jgi:hypothetical protein
MAIGSFTVGRDASAVVIAPNGARLDLTLVTDFKHAAHYTEVSSKSLSQPKQVRYLPEGHEISFNVDRLNSTNERLFAGIEAGWWASGSVDPGTSMNGSVFFYVTELDGSTTTHQFVGVSLKFSGFGDAKSESAIKQTITGYAQFWKVI